MKTKHKTGYLIFFICLLNMVSCSLPLKDIFTEYPDKSRLWSQFLNLGQLSRSLLLNLTLWNWSFLSWRCMGSLWPPLGQWSLAATIKASLQAFQVHNPCPRSCLPATSTLSTGAEYGPPAVCNSAVILYLNASLISQCSFKKITMATFKCLPCARHYAKHFTRIISFNFYSDPRTQYGNCLHFQMRKFK